MDFVGTHMHGFCRTGLFWKSWFFFFIFFFGEVVNHELKMRLEFCYHSAVLALNNKKLDHFKFLQMPFTSHPTAFYKSTTYFCPIFILLSIQKKKKKNLLPSINRTIGPIYIIKSKLSTSRRCPCCCHGNRGPMAHQSALYKESKADQKQPTNNSLSAG